MTDDDKTQLASETVFASNETADSATQVTGVDKQVSVTEVAIDGPEPDPFLTTVATRVAGAGSRFEPSGLSELGEVVRTARDAGLLVRDRFVLLNQLGAGGMGSVFKARDLRREEAGDRDSLVAIKFLGAAFMEHPDALVTLQREARKTQALAHPNIVTVYDFDRDEDRVFMTMELLKGEPLADIAVLDVNGRAAPDRLALLRQLAEGLAYAHSQDIVHSDLKPENVFITHDGRLKILDFGIARLAAGAASDDSFDVSCLGAITRRYASPEMLEGAPSTPADDVYALGLLGWWIFTGSHPFQGKAADEASAAGLQPAALPREVPHRVQEALKRAVSFDRSDRQSDAGEFLKQISDSRPRQWLLAFVAVLLIAVSGAWMLQSLEPPAPDVAFSELPTQVQAQFTQYISDADEHLALGDFDGALRLYDEAWELHPWNPDLVSDLDDLMAQLAIQSEQLTSQEDRALLMRALEGLSLAPFLETSEEYAELIKGL